METVPFDDKCVLIFGGCGTLGQAITRYLLDTKRCKLVVLADIDIESSKAASISDEQTIKVRCDITKEQDVFETFNHCKQRKVSIDIVINCVTVVGEQNPSKLFDVNVKGCQHLIQASLQSLSPQVTKETTTSSSWTPVVVNVSSTAGLTCVGDICAVPCFAASQHAVVTLTRTYGTPLYFEKHGVRVLCVCPHLIDKSNECESKIENWNEWTDDVEAQKLLEDSTRDKVMLTGEEVAHKLINMVNAKNGSVWMIRPQQFKTFNIPDYQLPKRQGHAQDPTNLRLSFGIQF